MWITKKSFPNGCANFTIVLMKNWVNLCLIVPKSMKDGVMVGWMALVINSLKLMQGLTESVPSSTIGCSYFVFIIFFMIWILIGVDTVVTIVVFL